MTIDFQVQGTREQMRARAKLLRRARKNNLSLATRQERTKKAANTVGSMNRELDEFWKGCDEFIDRFAEKYKMTRAKAARKVMRLSGYGVRRAVTPYNAYIFCRSLEENEGRDEGERMKLNELRKVALENEAWKSIPKDVMKEMKRAVEEHRLLKRRGARRSTKAQAHDAIACLKRTDEDLKNLEYRCATTSFRVTVKTCYDSTVLANYYVDDVSEKFLEQILKMSRREFVSRFEAFAISGTSGNRTSVAVANSNSRKTMFKTSIRRILGDQLRELLDSDNVLMPWKSYNTFVEKYHVRLINWPLKEVGPIDSLNETALEQINDAVESGDCKWEDVPEDEWAVVEPQQKKRKERSDKGKKRQTKRQRIETNSECSPEQD